MSITVVAVPGPLARKLIRWAALFARARDCDVVVIRPVRRPGETVIREFPPPDRGEEEAPSEGKEGEPDPLLAVIDEVRAAMPGLPAPRPKEGEDEEEPAPPAFTLVRVEAADTVGPVLAQVAKAKADLLVLGRSEKPADDEEPVERIYRAASSRTLLIRPGEDERETAERILVPTAGGPHADLALQLGVDLAAASGGRVTALYVQTSLGEDAESLAEKTLSKATARASRGEVRISEKVVLARSVREAVADEAAGHDLVLLGTSNQWFGRRVLFSTLPRALLSGPEGASVGVVRRSIPISTRLERTFRRVFEATVPQMNRTERVDLAEKLQSSSSWNFDFILMTCLSTLIATLGLIQDSIAVVIGAMLVAPLMSPLIGAGLALVQGNHRFLQHTLRSVLFGFLLAFGIASLLGLIIGPTINHELAARTHPGVLDLAVAFFSGMAAAYAIARPNLSAALPGVAIAAALVPPIAATGVFVSSGAFWLAAGAALLFFTNIVAIVLGAALSLFSGGVRSFHLHSREKPWVRRLTLGAFLLAAILVIVLGFALADYAKSEANLHEERIGTPE